MARLRLMLVLLACCGRSEAAPAGMVAPKGWSADPALAKTAASAIGDGITVTGSDAWSEPSRGCYAIWLGLHGGASAVDADQIIAALGKEKIAVRDVVKPTAAAPVLTLGFDRGGFHGTLRADLAATGDVSALACMWNDREPKACAAGCATLGAK